MAKTKVHDEDRVKIIRKSIRMFGDIMQLVPPEEGAKLVNVNNYGKDSIHTHEVIWKVENEQD